MAGSTSHEQSDSIDSAALGYDPNYVPDSVKSFVVHMYRHIREKNVYEIHQMYENSFQSISDRFFKDSPWPSVDAVAPYVDNDHVFCLLYREMWFRHLYARLSPTLKQRIDSWDNYLRPALWPLNSHLQPSPLTAPPALASHCLV